jgi:hypothetical protein
MLTIHRRSVTSAELLKVRVEQARSQTHVDLTTLPVFMAVIVDGDRPDSGDYAAAGWELIDGNMYAVALVGPGGIQLAMTDEMYVPWVKIVAGSETIEVKCLDDVIEVY